MHSLAHDAVRRPAAAAKTVVAPAAFVKQAPWVVILMMAIVVVRLQELNGVVAAVRPGMLVPVAGLAFLLASSRPGCLASVLSYRPTKLVLAYYGFAAVTAPFALWPGLAFDTLWSLLPSILLFLGILLCPPTDGALRRVQLGMVVLVGVFASYAMLSGQAVAEGRLSISSMYDSNDMAALLTMFFPLCVAFALRGGGAVGWLAAATAVLSVATVVASGSRGGVLGLAAGAIVIAFGQRGGKRVFLLVALVVGGMLTWNLSSDSFRERMMTLTSLESDYNSTSEVGRTKVWKRGMTYFRENPVLGVGIGNFSVAEGDYLRSRSRRGKWSAAHNAFIQALAEMGAIGGALFVAVLLSAAARSGRLWWGLRTSGGEAVHRPELFACLSSFVVTAVFLSHAYFFPMFALLGIIFLADRTVAAQGTGRAAPLAVHPRALAHRHGGIPPLPSSSPSPILR